VGLPWSYQRRGIDLARDGDTVTVGTSPHSGALPGMTIIGFVIGAIAALTAIHTAESRAR